MSSSSTLVSVNGTNGDDTLYIPAGYDITQVSVNGGKGVNTLDLSTYEPNTTPGVYIDFETPGARSAGSVVSDFSFHGIAASIGNTNPAVFGTISNIQRVIGTTGNDILSSNATVPSVYFSGGAGNDWLQVSAATNATLIGGTGYDWLQTSAAHATLFGGTVNASGAANMDSSYDTFQVGIYGATIMDFSSTDRLIFGSNHGADAAFAAATWQSDGHGGSELMVNGTARIDLAGVSLATAETISYGFQYASQYGILYGGSSNDVLRCGNGTDTVQIGSNLGNDIVTSFDKSADILDFTNDVQVSWSDTEVNGQQALLGTFAGGSVTLTGLATSDVSSLHIEGLTTLWTIDPTHHMSWWSVPSDAALI